MDCWEDRDRILISPQLSGSGAVNGEISSGIAQSGPDLGSRILPPLCTAINRQVI